MKIVVDKHQLFWTEKIAPDFCSIDVENAAQAMDFILFEVVFTC